MRKIWWKEAVVYQIYPRSFFDSNHDGVGDLRGIIRKIDYLKDLGVDVLWLSPINRSPNHDNGYDISDYREIMAEFGTMADFEQLIELVHSKGMKVILDLVVNHTSDEHHWFQESRKSQQNPYRDWYVWRPGKAGREPNNWESIFRGSAWKYDEATGEYFLHLFSEQQPDLNWENPAVRHAMYDMMRWWLDKGVDGFRIDAANFLSKEPGLPDAPPRRDSPYAIAAQYYAFGPRLNEFMTEMKRDVFAKYDILTVGEAAFADIERAVEMTHEDDGYLNMIFHFEHTLLDTEPSERITWKPKPLKISELKSVLSRWQEGMQGRAWNSQFFGNHDLPRGVSRFADDGQYRVESAKLLATIQFTLAGTPFIYQGEEIGMTNVAFPSIDDYRDIATLNAYAEYVDVDGMSPDDVMPLVHRFSRDNARTPMQWSDNQFAGFSTSQPWIGVNPNYTKINVEEALADPNSVLHFYREIIRLRKEHPVIVYGDYELIDETLDDVFAFWRRLGSTQLLVLGNFSQQSQNIEMPSGNHPWTESLLLGNYTGRIQYLDNNATLRPYEVRVYLLN